jgi:hypothetical protein
MVGIIHQIIGDSPNATATTSTVETKQTQAVTQTTAVEAIKVDAKDLIKAYTNNEVSADNQYKGKVVEVTGTVKDISVILGKTSITVGTNAELEAVKVFCSFDDKAEIDKIAKLNKGDTITVIGKVQGKSLDVTLDNCKIK